MTPCFSCGRPHKNYAGDGFCSVGCRAGGQSPLVGTMTIKRDESGRIDTMGAKGEIFLECLDDDQWCLLIREDNDTEHRVFITADTEIVVRVED